MINDFDEKARIDLDRKNADPADHFSYEYEQRKLELRAKRRKSMRDSSVEKISKINSQELRENVQNGRGDFQGIFISNDQIDFDISGCNFDNATFIDVVFGRNVNFIETSTSECIFIRCKFLTVVTLEDVSFDDCVLINTDISWHGNSIKNTIIHRDSPGTWEKLKSSYTGNGARFHVLLSLLYFVPLGFHIFVNFMIMKIQEIAVQFRLVFPAIDQYFDLRERKGSLISGIFTGDGSFASKYILIFVLLYQIQRITLTFYVGKMADEQEYGQIMPGFFSLKVMKIMHYINLFLMLFVLWGVCENIWNLAWLRLWVVKH